MKLRNLEDSLLQALSSVKGNILDDETVMGSLERLKNEAKEIQKKMKSAVLSLVLVTHALLVLFTARVTR